MKGPRVNNKTWGICTCAKDNLNVPKTMILHTVLFTSLRMTRVHFFVHPKPSKLSGLPGAHTPCQCQSFLALCHPFELGASYFVHAHQYPYFAYGSCTLVELQLATLNQVSMAVNHFAKIGDEQRHFVVCQHLC